MPASLLRGALRTPGEDDTSLDHDVPTEFCNTKLTHGHDLTGHRSSPARGLLPRLRSCASLARRHVESRVDLRDHLDAPSRAHHPCANAWRDRTRAVRPAPKVFPSNACSRRPRSHNLSPPKSRPSSGHPDSSRDARWISTAAARAGGSERRTGTFHSPVTRVFSASSPPRKPPNILVSPIAGARLLEGDSPAYLDRPRPPTRATPREGWRLFDGQDVWIRS